MSAPKTPRLIHVTPAPDRLVHLPGTREELPADGRNVEDASFWRRRESDGDVIVSAAVTETEVPASKSKPAKKD